MSEFGTVSSKPMLLVPEGQSVVVAEIPIPSIASSPVTALSNGSGTRLSSTTLTVNSRMVGLMHRVAKKQLQIDYDIKMFALRGGHGNEQYFEISATSSMPGDSEVFQNFADHLGNILSRPFELTVASPQAGQERHVYGGPNVAEVAEFQSQCAHDRAIYAGNETRVPGFDETVRGTVAVYLFAHNDQGESEILKTDVDRTGIDCDGGDHLKIAVGRAHDAGYINVQSFDEHHPAARAINPAGCHRLYAAADESTLDDTQVQNPSIQ